MSAPRLLVVAGRDSSGAAGVDADREAAEALGVRFHAVVTADTRQDDERVLEVGERSSERWLAEARERAAELPGALKLGLLPGLAHVVAAAQLVRELRARDAELPVVVDPVIVASSGHRFLDAVAVSALRDELLPLGLVWTPNLFEAAELAGTRAGATALPEQRLDSARRLLAAGARALVVTGGHGSEEPLRELVLVQGRDPRWITRRRLAGSIRGSGCRFASALAAGLARGEAVAQAAERAGAYVAGVIAARLPG